MFEITPLLSTPVRTSGLARENVKFLKIFQFSGLRPRSKFCTGKIMKPTGDDMKSSWE